MFKSILRLILITSISIFILVTYHSTVQIYGVFEADDAELILGKLIPGAVEFKPVIGEDGEPIYYEAFDTEGRLVAYGFISDIRGMWSDIQIAGGVDLAYRLAAIKILEHGETPGIGSLIETSGFQQQFEGLEVDEIRLTRQGGKVDAITGATVSSRAVTEGIRTELERVVAYTGNGE